MKRVSGLNIFVFGVLLSIVFGACAREGLGETAGTSIETTNGIAGVMTDEAGRPVAQALVRLRSETYLSPVASLAKIPIAYADVYTDSAGRYGFANVAPGGYFVEVTSGDSLMIRSPLTIDSLAEMLIVNEQLKKPAVVSGVVTLPKETLMNNRVWLLVYGLERVVTLDTNGAYSLTVAEGEFRFRVMVNQEGFTPFDIDSVQTKSGEITVLNFVGPADGGAESSADTDGLSVDSEGAESSKEQLSSVSSSASQSSVEEQLPLLIFEADTTYSIDGGGSVVLGDETRLLNPDSGSYTVMFDCVIQGSEPQYILSKGNTYAIDEGWLFFIEDDFINWRTNSTGAQEQMAGMHFPLSEIEFGQTVTLTGVVNRAVDSLEAFVNGSPVGWVAGYRTSLHNRMEGFGAIQNDHPIIVGGVPGADPATGLAYFGGSVTHVRIYNYALTAEEIKQIITTP